MDRFDRIFALHRLLAARRTPISRKALEDELDASRATVKRTIEDMRNTLNAPIEYDRARNGYYYDRDPAVAPFELPGLWFNSDELFALLTTHTLLSRIQPSLLDDFVEPFLARIEAQLPKLVRGGAKADWQQIAERVRILQQGARPAPVKEFREVVGALVRRQRLKILYHGRERDETTERVVSPQRLVYYRDNWYLGAWCHLREDLRSFALDRVHPVKYEEITSIEVAPAALDTHFTAAYGIFAGPATAVAHLRFNPHAAKWVADEHWHPAQESTVLADGGVELRVPYGDPRELIGEILKYGPHVEVLAPTELRTAVAEALTVALRQYAR